MERALTGCENILLLSGEGEKRVFLVSLCVRSRVKFYVITFFNQGALDTGHKLSKCYEINYWLLGEKEKNSLVIVYLLWCQNLVVHKRYSILLNNWSS